MRADAGTLSGETGELEKDVVWALTIDFDFTRMPHSQMQKTGLAILLDAEQSHRQPAIDYLGM